MWHKWFDNEIAQFANSIANFLILVHALLNPGFHFIEVLVDADESKLATTFYQLIGLDNQWLKKKINKLVYFLRI